MSSIAHILAHDQTSQKTSTPAITTTKEPDTLKKSSVSSMELPKITTSSSQEDLKSNSAVPRDISATSAENSLTDGNELRSASSSDGSTTHPITPAVRTSVDMTAEQNQQNGASESSVNDENQIKHQRKRSKVSRACDECRRKKIRCDATFSSTSNSVVKPCTSCIKNKEGCSFDRVPLKRGPTKGYTKPENESRERSRSTTSRRSSSMGNPQIQQQQTHQQTHQVRQSSSSSPITLPPLVSLTNNVPFMNYNSTNPTSSRNSTNGNNNKPDSPNAISQPTSPRRGSTFSQSGDPLSSIPPAGAQPPNSNGSVPQGLFWKVPYNQGPFDRRGSVDSVSSSMSDSRSSRYSSNASGGGNFIFGQRPVAYESSVISDSEDDRGSSYSPRASIDVNRMNRSRSNSSNLQQPASPAMSLSSLNSLSQGFNKNINIQNSNFALAQQKQNQMVELYYQLIHPTFPILPLNKQSLGNLLAIPAPSSESSSDIHEVNNLIVHTFYSSLDVLISASSRGSRSPSLLSQSNVNTPLDIITLNFSNLIKVFPVFQSKFNLYSQNIVILLTSSLVLLSYSVALLGFESDVYISSSVAIFNKLKIFRLFWDKNHIVTGDNYDDYNSILKRLYVGLDIIDTLQSLSFGIPKLVSVEYEPTLVDTLFPKFANFNGITGLDFELSKKNLKFGLILTKISTSRNFSTPGFSPASFLSDLKNKYNYFTNVVEKTVSKNPNHNDQTAAYFLDLVIARFELVGFLEEVCQSVKTDHKLDEELIYDSQLKALRIVKKHLELQSNLLKSITNHTNSIDNSLLVSPYLPLAFRQSIKSLNIQKIIINSLQVNKDLVTRLSKPLNDLISLNNYLSLLKPFKTEELNNHINFVFISEHLKKMDELDGSSGSREKQSEILEHWVGLISDLKEFIQREDYDGWF